MSSGQTRGMALAVVLVLLLGLTVLALAGSAAAIASLALAGLDHQSALAFEAAEAGIARSVRAIAQGATLPADAVFEQTWPRLAPAAMTRVLLRVDRTPAASTWADGFSAGSGDTFARVHVTLIADGRAGRGAAVRIEQGLTFIAPTTGAAP